MGKGLVSLVFGSNDEEAVTPTCSQSRQNCKAGDIRLSLLNRVPGTPCYILVTSQNVSLSRLENGFNSMAEGTLGPLVCDVSPRELGVLNAPFPNRQDYNGHYLVTQTLCESFHMHCCICRLHNTYVT